MQVAVFEPPYRISVHLNKNRKFKHLCVTDRKNVCIGTPVTFFTSSAIDQKQTRSVEDWYSRMSCEKFDKERTYLAKTSIAIHGSRLCIGPCSQSRMYPYGNINIPKTLVDKASIAKLSTRVVGSIYTKGNIPARLTKS